MNRPGALVRVACVSCLAVALLALGAWQVAPKSGEPATPAGGRTEPAIRFTHYDVVIDSAGKSLGAYQVEVTFESGTVKLVGVESGDHAAYKEPPYYDPAALHNPRGARIILGAFNTGQDLPAGKTRVARIHVQVTGDVPRFEVKLATAADGAAERIEATATLTPGEDK